ncbi:adenosylhomocysteinase [Salmonella enterica subsp. diarizonae]|uniref:adenosylhomocysteinase n=1 Tax=Salmonella enterica TaxID=28901 RepID=UPI001CF5BD8B|nr:adenosylhomocysteinase [Salmonella enterica subsp. diarizonae]
MSKTNEYNIKDMALADQGLKRINWAKNHMPIMRNLISRLEKEKPFEGLTIGICLHVEAKTGVWVEALTRGGAKIAVTGSPGSTQDETAAALVNFHCIEAEHTTDFTRTLDERWLIDALKSISSHFDGEKGPQSSQAKMFYDSLIRNAENRRPPSPYPDKSQDELLFGALHTNQMNIPEYARRLIVKHDSDWHSTRDDTRWSSVFKVRDESPVVKMANGGFLEVTRWMDKVPPFASQRSVWHFHPLEFLEAINPKGNCACGRDITLDELCDIAPKADKDILAQYLQR